MDVDVDVAVAVAVADPRRKLANVPPTMPSVLISESHKLHTSDSPTSNVE